MMMDQRPRVGDDEYIAVQRQWNELGPSRHLIVDDALATANWFAQQLATLMRDHARHSILDVGCRDGYVTEWFKQRWPSLRAVGVDIVPEFVEAAVAKGIDARVADAHALPFNDSEFQMVVATQTLEHCWAPERAAAELFRVARHAVLIGVPCESAESFEGNPSHYMRCEDPVSWLDLLQPRVVGPWRLKAAMTSGAGQYFNGLWIR